MVRTVAARMIEALGHDVECAEDGVSAIRKLREAVNAGKSFDIAILDLTIKGGMGGEEAVRRMLEVDPRLKAIASSGYADRHVVSEFQAYGFKAFLSKPYRIDALRDNLNTLLS